MKTVSNCLQATSLLIILLFFSFFSHAHHGEVSVLFIYTDDARSAAGGKDYVETQIIAAMDDANNILISSEVDITLVIADMLEINVNENGFDADDAAVDMVMELANPLNLTFSQAHDLRDKTKADIVFLVFEGLDSALALSNCGTESSSCDHHFEEQAFAGSSRSKLLAYPFVVAHELGHIMGLNHDRTRDCGSEETTCVSGAFEYSYGYVYPLLIPANTEPEEFLEWGTVMAGARNFELINYFSNPRINHPDMDVPLGIEDVSDAARSLNEVAEIIENFRVSETDSRYGDEPPKYFRRARPSEVLFQAVLYINKSLRRANKKVACSGSIVDPYTMVTSAHCVFGYMDVVDKKINFGPAARIYYARDNKESIAVDKIKIHPEFTNKAADNNKDVAIISFKAPVYNTSYAKIASTAPSIDRNLLLTGWGVVSQNNKALQAVDLTYDPSCSAADELFCINHHISDGAGCGLQSDSANHISANGYLFGFHSFMRSDSNINMPSFDDAQAAHLSACKDPALQSYKDYYVKVWHEETSRFISSNMVRDDVLSFLYAKNSFIGIKRLNNDSPHQSDNPVVGLSKSDALALAYDDSQSTLYMVKDSGHVYQYKSGQLKYLTAWTLLVDIDATSITVDSNTSTLYISDKDGEVFRYDGKSEWASLGKAGVKKIIYDSNTSTLYGLTMSGGVLRYDANNKTWPIIGENLSGIDFVIDEGSSTLYLINNKGEISRYVASKSDSIHKWTLLLGIQASNIAIDNRTSTLIAANCSGQVFWYDDEDKDNIRWFLLGSMKAHNIFVDAGTSTLYAIDKDGSLYRYEGAHGGSINEWTHIGSDSDAIHEPDNFQHCLAVGLWTD